VELKKPTTYEEQVSLLIEKGIVINDYDDCKAFLSRVNYYYFSGFILPFLDRKTDKCILPVTFERLRGLYEFDAELRNLISFIVERIELFLRNKLSYYHAHKYGAEGYLLEDAFGSKHKKERFEKIIQKCISDHKNTAIVKHHQTKYSGHYPIWVIMEFLPVGSLSYFYSDMKNPDKKYIAEESYGVNYQVLESWMRCITDLRNKCAHCSRLYYWVFSAIPKMPRNVEYVQERRLFSQLYMLKMMYPESEKWEAHFFDKFEALVDRYSGVINPVHLGMPDNWRELLKG